MNWIQRKKNLFKELCTTIINQEPYFIADLERETFFIKYYKFIANTLRFLQLWPYSRSNKSPLKKFLYSILYYAPALTLIIPQIASTIKYNFDTYDLIMSWSVMLYLTMCVAKYTAFLMNPLGVKALFDKILNDWQMITNKKQREFLDEYYKRGKYYQRLYIVVAFVIWGVCGCLLYVPFVCESLFDIRNNTKLRVLQYPGYYFFELDRTGNLLNYLHISVVGFVNCFLIVSNDTFFIMATCHIGGLFKILCDKLENIRIESSYHRYTTSKNCDYLLQDLRQIVTFQCQIYNNIALLETTFNISFFVVEALCVVMLPMTLYLIYNSPEYPIMGVQLLIYNFGFMLEVYYLNLAGQLIIDQSGEIYNSIYYSDWYQLPVEHKKMLRIVMTRSLHPSKITIGKLTTLSLPTFLTIMQTIFSYFTVLVSTL